MHRGRASKQLELDLHRHGGKRRGAGRKPNGERAGVSHLRRSRLTRLLPIHVTVRMERHVYNLRSRRAFSIVGRAIASAASRFGVTIVQFSVQGNHVHLIVEASDTGALSRAMQGFSIRVAKGLNRLMGRAGRVLADRFHSHVLRSPTEARRAVAYVRNNHRKHTGASRLARASADLYASPAAPVALPSPRSWLLRARASPS